MAKRAPVFLGIALAACLACAAVALGIHAKHASTASGAKLMLMATVDGLSAEELEREGVEPLRALLRGHSNVVRVETLSEPPTSFLRATLREGVDPGFVGRPLRREDEHARHRHGRRPAGRRGALHGRRR